MGRMLPTSIAKETKYFFLVTLIVISRHLTCLYGLFGLNQLVREPTRVAVNSSSTIDHIATNCANNIIKSGVHDISLSDHFMVYCIRKQNGAIEKAIK